MSTKAKTKPKKKEAVGKVFERSFKESAPEYCLLHRLSDSAQAFGKNDVLRFSIKNPFDYILWDSKRHVLYALELKTKAKHSITFERKPDDKGDIHYHQIQGLLKWSQYSGVRSGFVIEFRELEKTIFIDVQDFVGFMNVLDKRSFVFNDLDKYGIPYFVIPQELVRTQYKYDIELFLGRGSKECETIVF